MNNSWVNTSYTATLKLVWKLFTPFYYVYSVSEVQFGRQESTEEWSPPLSACLLP